MSNKQGPALLCFAHHGEARAFMVNAKRQVLGIVEDLYHTDVGYILITGEGLYNSLQALTATLSLKNEICNVINFGVAGSLSDDLNINEIIEVRTIYASADEGFEFKSFTLNENAKFDCISAYKRINSEKDSQPLRVIASIVDRELWAIAKVCHDFSRPLRSFKIISDFASDGSSCLRVKEQAESFSQKLFEHYSALELPMKHSNIEQSLLNNLYFTVSQKDLYLKLLSQLKLKLNQTGGQIIETLMSKVDHSLKPKAKTAMLLKLMNEVLNPHRVEIEKQIENSLHLLRDNAIQVAYDKTFESSELELKIRFRSEKEKTSIIEKLKAFDFSKFEAVLDPHED